MAEQNQAIHVQWTPPPSETREDVFVKTLFVHLVNHAIQRRTITYAELASLIGLPPSGNHMASTLGRYLGRILEWCSNTGHPHLTSLVVKGEGSPQGGIPGKGFWALLNLQNTTTKERRLLTKTYQDAVFNYYGQL